MAKPHYGYQHQRERTAWAPIVATGTIRCTGPQGCDQPIRPGQPWDLGHTLDHAQGGDHHRRTPQHAHCNRRAGAQLGSQRNRQPSNHAL